MSYRLNTQVKPLIWVECVVESHSNSRMEYMLKVTSHPWIRGRTLMQHARQEHSSSDEAQRTMSQS
jgi:hypothetical protein